MIQVYADNNLIFDNRLDDYRLLALEYTAGINVSGTASFTMPPSHPAFNSLTAYKTEIRILKDNLLLFRGRALTPSDDFYNCRTITCEGERGFLLDSVIEPYLYQDSPGNVFSDIITKHNSQVEAFKQFKVGTVTVTDPNEYIRLESEKAENTSAVLDKLVERCGGFIVFTTNTDGDRVINWYASIGYAVNQTIEFGQNLTDYTREDGASQPITVLFPYGAKDANGEYLTIESVNNGLKYIQDDEAVQLRGRIAAAVYWDDVTVPGNLLSKAQVYLNTQKNIITRLQLSAVDLSALDTNINTFRPGDKVRVISAPHGVNEDFLLMEKSEDLLNPSAGRVVLGKEKTSLTGLGVAGDKQNSNALHQITESIRQDYTKDLENAIQTTETALRSYIEQTSEAITSAVAKEYITNEQLTESLSTSATQTAEEFEFKFNTLQTVVDENDEDMRAHIIEQEKYIRFRDGAIILGNSEASSMTLTLENDIISFKKNGQQFGWWDGVDFHTGNIVIDVSERAQFGAFAFLPRSNGSLSFAKIT